MREIHRKQLNEAETRLANSKHAENQLSEELSNLKTKYVQLQSENDDEKRLVSALQTQLSTLQKSFNEKEVSTKVNSIKIERISNRLNFFATGKVEKGDGRATQHVEKFLSGAVGRQGERKAERVSAATR